MLQLRNRTPFACSLAVLPDAEAVDTLVIAVRGAFSFAGGTLPGEGRSEPVEPACGLPKSATDVLLSGHAYAPGGRATGCDVELHVGPVRKRVRVLGDRTWNRGAFGLRSSDPLEFERLPLAWERAYGGTGATRDGGTTCDERNPVGIGFAPPGERPAAGSPLPNLERPEAPITSWRNRPLPTGFSAIPAHWQPRRAWAGTCDESWRRARAPYLPRDFDSRFLQVAPPDLVADGHLRGDEEVELVNASPSGRERFRLPDITLDVACRVAGMTHGCAANLDTVSFAADLREIHLLWRASWRCDKRALDVEAVEIAMGGPGA